MWSVYPQRSPLRKNTSEPHTFICVVDHLTWNGWESAVRGFDVMLDAKGVLVIYERTTSSEVTKASPDDYAVIARLIEIVYIPPVTARHSGAAASFRPSTPGKPAQKAPNAPEKPRKPGQPCNPIGSGSWGSNEALSRAS